MRFIDLIRHNLKPNDQRQNFYREAKVIVADNVADYYWRGTDQEEWDLDNDFPNIAPPFPRMFVEYKIPAYSLSKYFGQQPLNGDFGACEIYADLWQGRVRGQIEKHFKSTGVNIDNLFHSDPKWVLTICPVFGAFGTFRDQMVAITLFVGPDGSYIGTRRFDGTPACYTCTSLTDKITSAADLTTWRDATMPLAHVALLTFSFMHCKNVECREVTPPPKLAKAHQKRTGMILHKHHVIEIDPMKSILLAASRQHGVGPRQALHICRGHFKTYRGRGLFGKHAGTFWWPQALRGTAQQGVITSEYAVKSIREVSHGEAV